MSQPGLRGLSLEEVQNLCLELGIPKFRAAQVFDWVQAKGVVAWEEMSNVPVKVRETLARTVEFGQVTLLRTQISRLDGTRKFLFGLADGNSIESVLMLYDRKESRDRATVCASTQVGCAMGCAFCATGLSGLVRNLDPSEITGQILDIYHLTRQEDPQFRVTNIVFMGMGEPLQNYANLLHAVELLNSSAGQNIGMRRMTVSTCGVVPRILDLARDNPQLTLAISLHAARDEVRDQLVPINRHYPLQELLAACRKYIEVTNRRITFEYALIKGTNADPRDARDLARLVKDLLCHINIIPVNPVNETGMQRPSREEIRQFAGILAEAGVETSVREEKGADIDAACGQLRKSQGGDCGDIAGQV